MIRNPFATAVDRPLQRDRSARLLPWTVALTVYLAALGGVGLVAAGDALRAWDTSLAGTMTLQVPADASAARLSTVVALLRQTHGIVSVHLLEPAETVRLVEPWLGPSIAVDRLPMPRIIDLRLTSAGATDIAELHQKLASIVPEAQLDEHKSLLEGLREGVLRVRSVIAGVMTVALLVTVVSAASTAHTGLQLHGEFVELLHLLGAGDGYIARQFQAQALRLGLLGAAAGMGAAALTILALAGIGGVSQLPSRVVADGLADWRVWAVLIGAMIAAGGLTMATARITVLRRLARMP
jgi:cell division transport system permease protein